MTVPIRSCPVGIDETDWNRLSGLNTRILDRLSYDHRRAAAASRAGVQTPEETWKRKKGVCSDYAAVFECLGREAGYEVRSITSDRLDHAWNEVHLDNRWWIVDVTWNDADSLVGGAAIPVKVRNDLDFQRRYLLTTIEEEQVLAGAGLLSRTHETHDQELVDFAQTVRAKQIGRQIDDQVAKMNQIIREFNATGREREALRQQFNDIVDRFNQSPRPDEQRKLQPRLEQLEAAIEKADATQVTRESDITARRAEIDALYDQFKAIESAYPIAVTYEL